MARAELTVLETNRSTGVVLSYQAMTADGIYFDNAKSDAVIIVDNQDATSKTVTIKNPSTVDGNVVADDTFSVAAGATRAFGPFPKLYNQTGDVVNVDVDDSTSVSIAALRFGTLAY